jgi:hypothetical protein
VAYVLHGHRIGDDTTTAEVLDTIPVAPTGWTDLAEIRLLGQRWLRPAVNGAGAVPGNTPTAPRAAPGVAGPDTGSCA